MGNSWRNIIPLSVLVLAFAAITLAQQTRPAPIAGPATTPASAAPTPAQSQSEYVEGTAAVLKVRTRLVVVDVIALDHKGIPVTDLKADDFTLLEEKQPQKSASSTFSKAHKDNPL